MFTLPSGEVALARLVDLAAEQAEVSIEYDASAIRGSMTIRLGEPLSKEQLWRVTNDLLASRGFTTIRRGDVEPILSVVKLQDAARAAAVHRGFDTIPDPVPGFVSVELRLIHILPEDFVAKVQPMLMPSAGEVSALPETGSVQITDLTPSVKRIIELASVLDRPEARESLEIVPVRSLPPADIVRLIGEVHNAKNASRDSSDAGPELIEGSDGRSVIVVANEAVRAEIRALIEQLDAQAARVTRLYNPVHFALPDVASLIQSSLAVGPDDPQIDIVQDELTSTLQVTAAPVFHRRIEELMDRLEAVPAEVRRPLRTYPVRNRDVDEIAALVRELVDAGVLKAAGASPDRSPTRFDRSTDTLTPGDARNGRPAGAPRFTPEREPPPERGTVPERIQIAVDRPTSRLLAIGEPRDLDRVGELIEQLDVRQPQVMLEMMMVSLSDGESLDLGVELQRLIDDAGTLVGLTSLFGISGISPVEGDPESPLGSGTGGTVVVLDPGDFSAVVRAVENISDGRAQSIPKLLVNNNESGTINSTIEVPFISTNASDTVATTSFGGSSAAGTQVSVTPQIAEGDHIILQYSVSLSSFVGESADPALPPPRQQNSISSRATIPDGYTIAVGGIEVTSEAEAETRVPLVGEIPGLGELFKNRSKSQSRSRFFAFIRANVMRHTSFDDLKHLSRPMSNAAGLEDDLPVLMPRIIR